MAQGRIPTPRTPSGLGRFLRAVGIEIPAEILGAGTIATVMHILKGRGSQTNSAQPKTHNAVAMILELYPKRAPGDIPSDWIEKSKQYVRTGGGLPEEKDIVNSHFPEEEKNRRLRELHANRVTQDNLHRRHKLLIWESDLTNTQREQLELLPTQTLKQLLTEDDPEERNTILKAVVDRTFFENIPVAFRKIHKVWKDMEESFQQAYGHLDAKRCDALQWYMDWATRRRQRQEGRTTLVGRRQIIVIGIPGALGVIIVVMTIIRMVS